MTGVVFSTAFLRQTETTPVAAPLCFDWGRLFDSIFTAKKTTPVKTHSDSDGSPLIGIGVVFSIPDMDGSKNEGMGTSRSSPYKGWSGSANRSDELGLPKVHDQ